MPYSHSSVVHQRFRQTLFFHSVHIEEDADIVFQEKRMNRFITVFERHNVIWRLIYSWIYSLLSFAKMFHFKSIIFHSLLSKILFSSLLFCISLIRESWHTRNVSTGDSFLTKWKFLVKHHCLLTILISGYFCVWFSFLFSCSVVLNYFCCQHWKIQ